MLFFVCFGVFCFLLCFVFVFGEGDHFHNFSKDEQWASNPR